ncbi:MAG: signal recognition particle-docking protein FtsY [Candidatus Aenigmatarchaeota archaeon]
MFGFLKKKFSDVVDSLTKKKEEEERFEEKVEKIEETIEKEPERAVEEIKEILKEEKPAIKQYIEQELKQVQEEVKEKPEEKVSLFKKVIKKITEKKLSEEDVNPILNELENGLIEGDVAYEVAEKIKNDLKKSLLTLEIKRSEVKNVIVSRLKNSVMEILNVPNVNLMENVKVKKPYVILFLGFNGSGKTTTLAKVGKWLLNENYSCVFAAADTFRAASLEQLEEHAKRIGVDVIKHDYGADPAAVAYDAISHAKSKGIHFVLIDSAGRTHTNANLMDEMKKIIRVNKPDLKILVIDSMTGNDAILQARMFNDAGVDAVIFTKLDVNEKGGAILSVTHELKKPILFLCNGQNYENVIKFNAKEFVDNLVGV